MRTNIVNTRAGFGQPTIESTANRRARKNPLRVSDKTYRAPVDLRVTRTKLRRVLVVDSYLLRDWPRAVEKPIQDAPWDFVLINNSCSLPAAPPRPISEYSFQLVKLPLRTGVPDRSYFRLDFNDSTAYAFGGGPYHITMCGRLESETQRLESMPPILNDY